MLDIQLKKINDKIKELPPHEQGEMIGRINRVLTLPRLLNRQMIDKALSDSEVHLELNDSHHPFDGPAK